MSPVQFDRTTVDNTSGKWLLDVVGSWGKITWDTLGHGLCHTIMELKQRYIQYIALWLIYIVLVFFWLVELLEKLSQS